MPPKKKDGDRSNAETVDQIDLHKYYSKEICDVLFLNEVDETSKKTLEKIIAVARTYEDISYLTFITYDDVMDFLRNYKSANVPPSIKPTLEDICTRIEGLTEENEGIPSDLFAQLMKLKLIQVMYHHYSKEVTIMLKRKKLEEDLNILTKECKKADLGGKGGKGGKDSKSGGSKSGKSTIASSDKKKKGNESAPMIEDYTTIPIETENDIIFDDDIFNHVWFYVFEGFYDPDLLYEFCNINVPITAVMKVTAHPDEESMISCESHKNFYDYYWTNMFAYFDGPGRLKQLENTILMRFSTYGDDFKESFQQLLYVVKNISDIKLQHLNYLRHINIYEVKEIYNYSPLECLNVYNRIMDKIPLELSNESVLLNSLLGEVCVRVGSSKSTSTLLENFSNHSVRYLKSYTEVSCVDPCKIQAFFKNRQKTKPEKIISKKPAHSFMTHECDEVNVVLHSYKRYAPLVCDPIIDLLKTQKPIEILNSYLTDYTEVIHKHDVDPSTKTFPDDEEIFMHIFYLMFFSNFDCREVVTDFDDTELTKNLQTYHKIDFVESAQTSVQEVIQSDEEMAHEEEMKSSEESSEPGEGTDSYDINVLKDYIENNAELNDDISMLNEEYQNEEETYHPMDCDRNYYSKPAIQYFWKENFKPDVLLQKIFKAQKNYLYMEQKYSPGTDNLLLQFSDCLDHFGINTKIYEQSLITPICLRDFCRYITVEKADWLEKNKPPKYYRKCEDIELCKGVARINQLQLFQEYSHLLETALKTEKEHEEKQPLIENSVSFEQLLNELKNYPSNLGIVNECNSSAYEANFLAYDFGTKYFQIKGAITTFHSHDNVKITVDNTRFLDEDLNKCTVNLSCKGNSLILHSNKYYLKEDYTFHMNLADGTVITYILLNRRVRRGARRGSDYEPPKLSNDNVPETANEKETESFTEPTEEMKVLSVDGDHFKNLENQNEDETPISTIEFKENEALFDSLRQAAALNCPVYKISNNLTHLKKLKPEVEIPVSNILRRVLHKTIQKKNFGSLTKRYLPKRQRRPRLRNVLDARIALPNGLYVSFYPSQFKNNPFEVKQEFLTKKLENSLIEHEEFRLFTREGYILVKQIDGTLRILKTNGDIIDYEKLDAESEAVKQWHLKPCHCKNINDYRKKLNRIIKRNYEDTTEAFVSRRAQFHTKKGYVLKPDLVNILKTSMVPYLKHVLTKFDGNRICLENERVTQKRVLHITEEQDYFAQEIYYERSDGFTSYFDRYGKQQVKFADGTKISSTIHVAKKLADGYVYISLNFEYEHPNYATVIYNHDNALQVVLKNAVFKVDADNSISVKVGEDIQTTAKIDHLIFHKTCTKCSSKYRCFFNIDPFTDRRTDPSGTFLYAKDSYNKRFCSDYGGRCKRNANYIRGPFNMFNCNHYKKMSYKKMFVVDKNLSGFMLWSDNMVDTKRKMTEQNEGVMVKEQEDVENAKIKVIKIRRKFFEKYSNRFLNTGLLRDQMCLAKYKRTEVKQLFYTTSRVIKKMTDFEGVQKCLSEIMAFFERYGIGTQLLTILENLLQEQKDNPDDDLSTRKVTEVFKAPSICLCVKDKVDIPGKIARWQKECNKYRALIRNNIINPYFTSQFCQVIGCNDGLCE